MISGYALDGRGRWSAGSDRKLLFGILKGAGCHGHGYLVMNEVYEMKGFGSGIVSLGEYGLVLGFVLRRKFTMWF